MSEIVIFKDTPYGEKDSLPFGITHGSLHPGDVVSRIGRCLENRIRQGAPGAYIYGMRVLRGTLHNCDLDRRFERFVYSHQGCLEIHRNESGLLSAHFKVETGETRHNEKILGNIEPTQVTQIDRLCESSDINVNPTRLATPVGLGVTAALTEYLPTVAELTLVLGTAWTCLVEKRIRFGVRFKYGEAGEKTGEMVCDIRQSGWFLLDSLWTPPYRNPK